MTAAYGADDVEMLEMMFQYLDGPSKDRARNQIKEKFPEEKEVKSYDFSPIICRAKASPLRELMQRSDNRAKQACAIMFLASINL